MIKISKVRKRPGKNQWAVYSGKGKKLSQWYPSRAKAIKRLRQIEYFKHNSDDQVNYILDFIDHGNYDDVLSTKPADGNFSVVSSLKKDAFGYVMNSGNNSVQGEQTPKLDDVTLRFFSGEDDVDLEGSLPNINNKADDMELEKLKNYLENSGEKKEAKLIEKMIKNSFEQEMWENFIVSDLYFVKTHRIPLKELDQIGSKLDSIFDRQDAIDKLYNQIPNLGFSLSDGEKDPNVIFACIWYLIKIEKDIDCNTSLQSSKGDVFNILEVLEKNSINKKNYKNVLKDLCYNDSNCWRAIKRDKNYFGFGSGFNIQYLCKEKPKIY